MANEKILVFYNDDTKINVYEEVQTSVQFINDDDTIQIIKIFEPGPQGPTGQSGSNASLPANTVSSSAQVDYLGIQNKPDLTQYLPNSYSSSVDTRFTQINNATSSFVNNYQTSSMSVLSASYSNFGGGIYGGSGYIPAGTQATLKNRYDNFFINYYNRPAISVDPDGAAGVIIDSPQGSSSFGVTEDYIFFYYKTKSIRVSDEIELNNSSSNIFVSSSSVVIKTDNFSKKNYFYAARNFPGNTNQRSYIGSYSDPNNYIGTYHDNASNNDYIFTFSTLNTGSNIRNNMYISPSKYKLNRINENNATTSSIYVSDYISLGVSSSQNYGNIYISESIKVRHGNSIVDVKEDEIVISGSFGYKNALYLSNFGVPNPTYRSFIGSYHDNNNYVATYQDEAGDGYYIFEGKFKDPTAQYSAGILGSPALVQLFSSFAGIINTIGVDYNDGVKLSSASGSRLTQIVANPQTGIVVSNTATDLGMRYNALYSGIVNNDRSIPDVGIVKILANNITGSFATTGSNIFTGTQQVTGSVNVTGSITVNNVRLIDEYTAIAYSIAL